MTLKRSEEGFTNPVGSSAYFPPPYPFRNAETVFVEYEPSREQVESELPEPLEYVEGNALAIIQDAQIASGAPFHEGYIFVPAKFKGITGYYAPYACGCPEEAVLANRELYGWPEVIADYPHPRFAKDAHTVTATVQRRGELFMKASVTLERQAKVEELPAMDDNLTLKKIPSPLKDGKPLRQVVHIRLENVDVHDVWAGRGTLELGVSSEFRIARLKPKKILRSYYLVMSWILPYALAAWDV
jgi:acetoacetate decarboxylase